MTNADAHADNLPDSLLPSIVGERLNNVTRELFDLVLFGLPPKMALLPPDDTGEEKEFDIDV